jgi:hypothetical protein
MKTGWLTAGVLAIAASGFGPAHLEARARPFRTGPLQPRLLGVRVGYDRGYGDGLRAGERAARRHAAFGRRDKAYRPADGPRHPDLASYRGGFEAGYREAYAAALRSEQRQPRADDDWADVGGL